MAWYDIEIPPRIQSVPGDYVAFTAAYVDAHKKDGEVVQDYMKAACYGSHMHHLDKYRFRCHTDNRASVLTYDIYARWIELCQENQIIPEGVTCSYEGTSYGYGNVLDIPRNGYNRHHIYTALCCYRWAENQARLPYVVVALTGINKNISFFQALHYAAVKYIPLSGGHSFCNLAMLSNTLSCYSNYGRSGQYFLPWSLAIRNFFAKNKNGKSRADTAAANDTSGQIAVAAVVQEPLRRVGSNVIELCVTRPEHLLWEEWADLYRIEQPSKQDVITYWKKVMEARKD